MRHELLAILIVMFAWPSGIVMGNLVANVFWVPLQWLGIHLRLKGHQIEIHDRFDEIVSLLDPCPNCGHRRSKPHLLRQHDSP